MVTASSRFRLAAVHPLGLFVRLVGLEWTNFMDTDLPMVQIKYE
jgi:hypothetical protein